MRNCRQKVGVDDSGLIIKAFFSDISSRFSHASQRIGPNELQTAGHEPRLAVLYLDMDEAG
jgi:hypothetical protein